METAIKNAVSRSVCQQPNSYFSKTRNLISSIHVSEDFFTFVKSIPNEIFGFTLVWFLYFSEHAKKFHQFWFFLLIWYWNSCFIVEVRVGFSRSTPHSRNSHFKKPFIRNFFYFVICLRKIWLTNDGKKCTLGWIVWNLFWPKLPNRFLPSRSQSPTTWLLKVFWDSYHWFSSSYDQSVIRPFSVGRRAYSFCI